MRMTYLAAVAICCLPLNSFSSDLNDDTLCIQRVNNKFENCTVRMAIEPSTIVTVAFSIGKFLFGIGDGNEGPDFADFAKNLSGQLEILNNKFDLLIEEISKLRSNVYQLPDIVVTKLKQKELQGAIGRYRAILSGIHQPEYNGDIESFMEDDVNKSNVQTLANDIRKIKSELETVDDPYVVPFVAIAVHIEYTLRQKYLGEALPTYAGFINEDQKFLMRNTINGNKSLKLNLNMLQKRWDSLIAINHYRFVAFVLDGPKRIRDIDNYYARYFEYYSSCSIEKTNYSDTTEEIRVFKLLGILDKNVESIRHNFPSPDVALQQIYIIGEPQMPEEWTFKAGDSYAYRIIQVKDKIRRIINFHNEILEQTYFDLCATASAYFSGLNAVEFGNVYLRAAGLIK